MPTASYNPYGVPRSQSARLRSAAARIPECLFLAYVCFAISHLVLRLVAIGIYNYFGPVSGELPMPFNYISSLGFISDVPLHLAKLVLVASFGFELFRPKLQWRIVVPSAVLYAVTFVPQCWIVVSWRFFHEPTNAIVFDLLWIPIVYLSMRNRKRAATC